MHDPNGFPQDAKVFEVDGNTLLDADVATPERNRDVYDFAEEDWRSPYALVSAMNGCYPLAREIGRLYSHFRDGLVKALAAEKATGNAMPDRRADLQRQLADLPLEPEEGAEDWLMQLEPAAFADVIGAVEEWLDQAPDPEDADWFSAGSDPQKAALAYFRDEDPDVLDALGVVIIEGEHPGSSYFAAELRTDIDAANRAAEKRGIPIRFVPASGGWRCPEGC